MRLEREDPAIRLFMYYLLSEPLKSGYSDDQLEEVLLREENKKRHIIKKGLMLDAFIACIRRNWQAFFEPYGCPGGLDGEAIILIAINYYKSLDTAEGYRNCALLKRVLRMIQQAIRTIRTLLPLTGSVTTEQIEIAVNVVLAISIYNGVDRDALIREVQSIYNIRMDDFSVIESSERRRPWINDKKASINWNFWNRYRDYVQVEKNFSNTVINQLDRLTDRTLDGLFDPTINAAISKYGLVVGQVQSGKTSNYTGLICKAADAGYKLIIVLAGVHNNLRSQTQLRLDEGFLGFDTQHQRAFDLNNLWIGVGRIEQGSVAHSLTSSLDKGDFTSGAANSLGINFNTNEPIIAIVKKNSRVLDRLLNWLTAQSVEIEGRRVIRNKSLLLIDDEADNASINTNPENDTATRINSLVRSIIRLFDKSGYVGYTATPFANIFIPINEDGLFPRDFIINIPAPSNYIGPDKVFGFQLVEDNATSDTVLPIVRRIDDYHHFVPNGHKNNDSLPGDVPQLIINSPLNEIDSNVRVHNWQDVLLHLNEAASRIQVKEINGGSADALNYFDHRNGLSVIAIGGDKLSRGLTLEGLSVSYYLRASRMYDTLMQMGRWFGYRPGYVDLCRLFTSRELNEWFCHIALASEELRNEFDYMSDIAGSTPEQYALRVRTHPGVLQISASNKIRRAVTVDISWAGRLVESYEFQKNPYVIHANLVAATDFIRGLEGNPQDVRDNYLWVDIPAQNVRQFLQRFRLSESLKAADPANLLRFIDVQLANNELTSWRVAVVSKRATTKRLQIDKNGSILNVGFYLRNYDERNSNSELYYLRKSHIISPRDEFIDLTDEEIATGLERTRHLWLRKNKDGQPTYPNGEIVRNEIRHPQRPLLLIYFLDPEGAGLPAESEPIVGYAISFPASRFNASVSYAVHEQLLPLFNQEDNLEEAEDDDEN